MESWYVFPKERKKIQRKGILEKAINVSKGNSRGKGEESHILPELFV
jgi:hypothetical protein